MNICKLWMKFFYNYEPRENFHQDHQLEYEEQLVQHNSHYINICGCPNNLHKDTRDGIFKKLMEGKLLLFYAFLLL